MAYLTIKKVKGRYYGYLQESYREGGSVRTRTVEYLGAIEPAVAKQVQATRNKLGEADRAALVQSVREAAANVTKPPEKSPERANRYERLIVNGQFEVVDMKTGAIIEPTESQAITTKYQESANRPFGEALKMPRDLRV